MEKRNHVKTLTGAAMLTAVAILLGFFNIPVSNIVEIRLGSLPLALSGILFGPGVSAVVGALSDIGAYFVKPTGPFFPGFTVSAALTGVLFALVLYRKKTSVPRILAAQALNTVIVGMGLSSLWLSILYGMPFQAVFAARLLKEIVMYPINCVILIAVIKSICHIPAITTFRQAPAK